MPRVRTEAERWTFLPQLDMPRVLNRGQMTKITATKTLFCTGGVWWCYGPLYCKQIHCGEDTHAKIYDSP